MASIRVIPCTCIGPSQGGRPGPAYVKLHKSRVVFRPIRLLSDGPSGYTGRSRILGPYYDEMLLTSRTLPPEQMYRCSESINEATRAWGIARKSPQNVIPELDIGHI